MAAPSPSPLSVDTRPPFSSISSEEHGAPQAERAAPKFEGKVPRDGVSPNSAGPLSDLSVGGVVIMAVLDSGDAASLACSKWLRRRGALLRRFGIPIARPYCACANFKFRGSRTENARFAADVPSGIATLFTAAGMLALLSKGALGSRGSNSVSTAIVFVWAGGRTGTIECQCCGPLAFECGPFRW